MRVEKTHKLFIGGAFVRSESGVTFIHGGRQYCDASRKDARDAVRAARGGVADWTGSDAQLRGLIVYRVAEMLAGTGRDWADTGAHRLVYWAGWTDKLGAVLGSANQVGGPLTSWTEIVGSGVTVCFVGDDPIGVIDAVGAAWAAGNAVVVTGGPDAAPVLETLAECAHLGDVPAGVLNTLPTTRTEVAETLARHGDVDALDLSGLSRKAAERLAALGGDRLTRRLCGPPADPLDRLGFQVEAKTLWLPVAP